MTRVGGFDRDREVLAIRDALLGSQRAFVRHCEHPSWTVLTGLDILPGQSLLCFAVCVGCGVLRMEGI